MADNKNNEIKTKNGERAKPTEAQISFSKNLNTLLRVNEKTQLELSKFVGVSTTSVNNWVKGYNTPRMDKIDAICKFFRVSRESLLSSPDKPITPALIFMGEFESLKDRDFAEKIFKDMDFRELVYTLENATSEQLKSLTDMVRRFYTGVDSAG